MSKDYVQISLYNNGDGGDDDNDPLQRCLRRFRLLPKFNNTERHHQSKWPTLLIARDNQMITWAA